MEPMDRMTSVSMLGRGEGAESYFLLHSARFAHALPIVDSRAALVGLAWGPSTLSPGSGLAVSAQAIREFLEGRSIEGRRPYLPRGQRASWPPPIP